MSDHQKAGGAALKKPRILFIDENSVVNFPGGIERVLCNFCNAFVEKGYEMALLCMNPEKGGLFFPLSPMVRFVNLWYEFGSGAFGGWRWQLKKIEKELIRTFAGKDMRIGKRSIKDPKKDYYNDEFIRRLHRFIETWKPNLLISIDPLAAYLGQRAMCSHPIPMIGMGHVDPEIPSVQYTEEQQDGLKHCDAFQVLMDDYADHYLTAGCKRVVTIPNAVEQIPDEMTADLSVVHHRIVHVGRIDGAGKRQHLLIDAFAQIAERYPEWSVHFYGSVDNRHYKKKLDTLVRKHHLEGRIIFEGPKGDIPAELRKADIFAFPSAYESFGLALAEAMSMGMPVLAYKSCRGAASLVQNEVSGILLEDGTEALARGLERLIKDQALRIRLGRAAHEKVKKYAPENVWNMWEQLICTLVKD